MKINKKTISYRKIVEYFLLVLTIIGFLVTLIFIFNNFLNPELINVIFILPFILFLTPYLILKLYDLKTVENKMEIVPRFLRDVVDNVESGTDLISSIKNTTSNEYGILNEDIKKLANQLSWNINFETAILSFANNIGSSDLQRDLALIVEARKVGGHVEKLLRELSQKILIDNLRKKERKSNLSSNTFTGYISFIIFVFIIILVFNSLFIDMATLDSEDISANANIKIYLTLFTLLTYELAILSGFLFGLMQENNIIRGAPHVVGLTFITFIAFFFFISF